MSENTIEFDPLSIIVSCQQTVHRFYAALDGSDFDTVANCMHPDGYWMRQGRELRGPAQVREALADRPVGRTTAHLVQNLVVTPHSGDEATATFMTLVYRVDLPEPAKGPVAMPAQPLSITTHTEQLRRVGSGDWLVVQKQSRRVFGD